MYFKFPTSQIDTTGLATDANQTAMINLLTLLNGYVDQIEGYVDGIETLLGLQATAANQTTIIGHIDGLEGLITTLNGLVATAAKQDTTNGHLTTIEGYLDQLEGYLDGVETLLTTLSANTTFLTVVDLLDTPVLDASLTPIPNGGYLQVVASLAANVKKIRVADTTGGFIGIYNGANALLGVINAGMDGELPLVIPSGTEIKLASLTGANITVGNLAINFLG
jgi:hypothetical protein